MLVKFNLKMQRKHICESWRTNRARVLTDYLPSAGVFCKKLNNQTSKAKTVHNEEKIGTTLAKVLDTDSD